MPLQLQRPLAIIDLETTGPAVASDRIIEVGLVILQPDGSSQTLQQRIKPAVPISAEAQTVHGISMEDLAEAPSWADYAPSLHQQLQGLDLAGYNILKFDLPLLLEEFSRVDLELDVESINILDAQKIFHLMEKRTLGAALRFYCQEELLDAHNATADAVATLKVLQAQVDRYEGQALEGPKGQALGNISTSVKTLSSMLNQDVVDLAGRFVLNDKGQAVLNFGKHKGRPVKEVLQAEPHFYDWMMRGDFPLNTKKILTRLRLELLQGS